MRAKWAKAPVSVLPWLLAEVLCAGALRLDKKEHWTQNEAFSLPDGFVNMSKFMEQFDLTLGLHSVSIDFWHGDHYHCITQLDDALSVAKRFGAKELRLPSNTSEQTRFARSGSIPHALGELPSVILLPSADVHVRSVIHHAHAMLEASASSRGAPAPVSVPALSGWTSIQGLLQRSSLTLHTNSVQITRWNGRTGNNLFQIGGALSLAKASGADTIIFPGAPNPVLTSMFVFPERSLKSSTNGTQTEIVLKIKPEKRENLWKNCRALIGDKAEEAPEVLRGVFWAVACKELPARAFHDLVQEALLPRMNATFAKCVNAPKNANESKLLTVHLRGDDYWIPMRINRTKRTFVNFHANWHEGEFPCSLFQSIRERHGLEQTLAITSRDRHHPCTGEFAAHGGVSVSVQSKSVWEDACALMRAEHSVLSWSSFSEFFALLSPHVRFIHHSGKFNYEKLRWCAESGEIWPGAHLIEYDTGLNITNFRDADGETWAQALINFSAEKAEAVKTTAAASCAAESSSAA